MKIGDVYKTNNHGDIKVVSYDNCYSVLVEFLLTGYQVVTNTSNINKGLVKDRLSPSVYGRGFIGCGSYKSRDRNGVTESYRAWTDMFTRCYSELSLLKSPSYIGCSVCVEWMDYQAFAKWHDENFIHGYALDKDIIKDGNKEYSPSTCMFVTCRDNVIKATAKNYSFINPEGVVVDIYNLRRFCLKNGICPSAMVQVHKGKAPAHKGWKKNIKSINY